MFGQNVHKYVQTSGGNSKFGVDCSEMEAVLDLLKKSEDLELVGLHCHLGSTIDNTDVYRYIYNHSNYTYI